MPYHGAKNFRKTVFPSVFSKKFSGVSSVAEEDAARARKKANCLIIVLSCVVIVGCVVLLLTIDYPLEKL